MRDKEEKFAKPFVGGYISLELHNKFILAINKKGIRLKKNYKTIDGLRDAINLFIKEEERFQ